MWWNRYVKHLPGQDKAQALMAVRSFSTTSRPASGRPPAALGRQPTSLSLLADPSAVTTGITMVMFR
jgi:hypothetical protein